MKYKIQTLDRRHAYHQLFNYYIGFSRSMWREQGPLDFARCQKWFVDTYGWSAEVQIYSDIQDWKDLAKLSLTKIDTDLTEVCNPKWSWSNSVNNQYRIYVASAAELSFFCLAHPLTGN